MASDSSVMSWTELQAARVFSAERTVACGRGKIGVAQAAGGHWEHAGTVILQPSYWTCVSAESGGGACAGRHDTRLADAGVHVAILHQVLHHSDSANTTAVIVMSACWCRAEQPQSCLEQQRQLWCMRCCQTRCAGAAQAAGTCVLALKGRRGCLDGTSS